MSLDALAARQRADYDGRAMNGPDHHRVAERLLQEAASRDQPGSGPCGAWSWRSCTPPSPRSLQLPCILMAGNGSKSLALDSAVQVPLPPAQFRTSNDSRGWLPGGHACRRWRRCTRGRVNKPLPVAWPAITLFTDAILAGSARRPAYDRGVVTAVAVPLRSELSTVTASQASHARLRSPARGPNSFRAGEQRWPSSASCRRTGCHFRPEIEMDGTRTLMLVAQVRGRRQPAGRLRRRTGQAR
jgi:hypothetical protein